MAMSKESKKGKSAFISLSDVPISSELPPIVIICFTRPELLQEVIAAIEQQTLLPQKILAFVDGARNGQEAELVEECIQLLTKLASKFEVQIITRAKNLGCDLNIIEALSEVLGQYSSLVYLEDDVVPNPYFYDRMCRLLEAYRDVKQVFSVNAYATIAGGAEQVIQEDFMISNRFFCWGFATWADRWYSLDLEKIRQGHNPFGKFYHIPLTAQSKLTMVNQFYLERTGKTDWVITVTLACLFQGYVHVTPMVSYVRNIGFSHPRSKTYRGGEPLWVNSGYNSVACPDKLPLAVELIDQLKRPCQDLEEIEFITRKNLDLRANEVWYLFFKYHSWKVKFLLLKLFIFQQIKRRFN